MSSSHAILKWPRGPACPSSSNSPMGPCLRKKAIGHCSWAEEFLTRLKLELDVRGRHTARRLCLLGSCLCFLDFALSFEVGHPHPRRVVLLAGVLQLAGEPLHHRLCGFTFSCSRYKTLLCIGKSSRLEIPLLEQVWFDRLCYLRVFRNFSTFNNSVWGVNTRSCSTRSVVLSSAISLSAGAGG